MAKHGKKYTDIVKIASTEPVSLEEAIAFIKAHPAAKFDETMEMGLRMGCDRTVILPHGTGKKVRVCVLTKGAKEKEAEEAGADVVGSDELITRIQGGWLEFDVVIATPDIMSQVGKLGKILGTRGLMPNPKSGTVTFEIGQAVKDAKAGKIAFRVDKYGIVNAAVGKKSFEPVQLKENVQAFMEMINRLKPTSAKGVYIKSVTISSTMSPGIRLDKSQIMDAV